MTLDEANSRGWRHFDGEFVFDFFPMPQNEVSFKGNINFGKIKEEENNVCLQQCQQCILKT